MPVKISLKNLFILTCILKVASSFVGWYLHEPWVFGLLLPLVFMTAYILIGHRMRDSDISAEKFADSCYYLGFIFTIASIIFSLFDLPNIGTDLTNIAVRFGAAMVSTVLGLAVRVALVSFRPNTDDAIRNVEDQVIEASRKLSDELQKSLDRVVDFRADVMRATDETIVAVKEQIMAMSEAQHTKTTEFFETMTQHNKEMMLGLMQDVRTTAVGMTRIISEYETMAKGATERIDQSVVTFVDGLVTRLDEVQFPEDLFSKRLEGAIAQLGHATETATDSIKSVTVDVQGSARLVNNAIKRINEKLESMGDVLDGVQEVGASLEELTNRLDGEDKQYGYIIDYKDLFKQLEGAIGDYTSGALDGYDEADVAGLLGDRLSKAEEDLEDAREAIKALCEPVEQPQDTPAYLRFFCGTDSDNAEQLKANEPKRLNLYKMTSVLIRCFGNIANELEEAGYSAKEIAEIQAEVDHFAKVRDEVKLASGDYIDLKAYEPDMRFLIDTYIRAEDSEKISAFDDMSLIELIVERGVGAIDALPKGIRESQEAMAETIENNVRKLIIDESPINPKYYETMSSLLDALIAKRKEDAISYQEYLAEVVELTKQAKNPTSASNYPGSINSNARKALYDNLGHDAGLALAVDAAVLDSRQDDWRGNTMKIKRVRLAIKSVLDQWGKDSAESQGSYSAGQDNERLEALLELVKHQHEY
ncbi:hypothetical protein D9M70_294920 [compost metagenome]